MKRLLVAGLFAVLVGVASLALAARDGDDAAGDWPLHNRDLARTRAAEASIDSGNVDRLEVRWRFPLQGGPREAGIFASNPLLVGDSVYLQDLMSNVFALDRETGRVRWSRWFRAGNPGPNGVAWDGGRVYGSTDTTAFALDAETGRTLWLRRTLRRGENFVDIAPVVADGRFYTSSIGYPPGGKGVLYGLDELGRASCRERV